MKTLGRGAVQQALQTFTATGTLYREESDYRPILLQQAAVTFGKEGKKFYVYFLGEKDGVRRSEKYLFHSKMDLKVYDIKGPKPRTFFCWKIVAKDQSAQVGCQINALQKDQFKLLFCSIIDLVKGSYIEEFSEEMGDIPAARQPSFGHRSKYLQDHLEEIISRESGQSQTKLAYTARLFELIGQTRTELNSAVVFAIKSKPNYSSSMVLYQINGSVLMERDISRNLNFEINASQYNLKWVDIQSGLRILEVKFDDPHIIHKVEFAIHISIFQRSNKKGIHQSYSEADLAYMEESKKGPQKMKKEFLEEYSGPKLKLNPNKIKSYQSSVVAEPNDPLCLTQATVQDYNIFTQKNHFELHRVDESGNFKKIGEKDLVDNAENEIAPKKMVMYDGDTKAMIAHEGGLCNIDIERMEVIEKYNPVPDKKQLNDMVASSKFAEEEKNNTFLAVTDNGLHLLDDRVAKTGLAESRQYKTNPGFVSVATTQQGNYVVGCTDGNIRFFNQGVDSKKHSLNNIPTFSSDVISVATSSDGLFVAGTYPTFVLIIPTFSKQDVSLYQKSLPLNYRPVPYTLQVPAQELNGLGIDPLAVSYSPAMFSQNRATKSRYIVTSIDNYIITWMLDSILRGQTIDIYTITDIALARTVQFKRNDESILLSAGPGVLKNMKSELIE